MPRQLENENPVASVPLSPDQDVSHSLARSETRERTACQNEAKPLVSVVVTTYGDCASLRRAIDSVLGQSYPSVECVVVDDNGIGTADGRLTASVMQSYADDDRVAYVQHAKNRNGSAARNTGASCAHGCYIAFLDNDDFYFPMKIECSVQALEKCPDVDAVLDNVLFVTSGVIVKRYMPNQGELNAGRLLLDNMLLGSGSNLFLRKCVVEELGGFDESYIRNQDVEFMLRFFRTRRAATSGAYGVVKTDDGTSNVPPYQKMKAVKQKLYADFRNDIALLSEEDRVAMRRKDASILYTLALAGGEPSEIREAAMRLREVSSSGFSDAVGRFVLRSKQPSALSALKLPLRYLRGRPAARSLCEEEKNYLRSLGIR